MKVREAVPEDATAACLVMRRSIAELCAADHRNDPAVVQRWLSNKTSEIFRSWIRPAIRCWLPSKATAFSPSAV